MTRNDVEGSSHGLILYTIPEISWTDRRKSTKSSRDGRREAEIRSEHLPNTIQNHYRLSQRGRCEAYNIEIYTYLLFFMM
jgi:hypothetical protein